MANSAMRTTLLLVLGMSFALVVGFLVPKAGAKARVTIHFSPADSGIRINVSSNAKRPLVLLVDGRRVVTRTTKGMRGIVPFRLVSTPQSRVVVRDARTQALLASEVLKTRFFLQPASPRLLLTRSPLGPTTARKARIAWRTNGYRTSCAIDGRAAKPCRSPLHLSGLPLGTHRVEVRVFVHNAWSSVTAAWTVRAKPVRDALLRRGGKTATPALATRQPTPPATVTPSTASETALATPTAKAAAPGTSTTASFGAPAAAPAPAPAGPVVTLTPSAFEAKASDGASIANVHVTGDARIAGRDVSVTNSTFDGVVTLGTGTVLTDSQALGFNAFGVDGWRVEGNVFDGQGRVPQNNVWDQPAGQTPDNWTIRNNRFVHFYSADPGVHSEALFIGYSTSGLIEGNTFDDNGNTSHVFFTWFGSAANAATSYPRNICVRGNTFGARHGAYYDVNLRAEIPTSAGIIVQPNASITDTRFRGSC
jgi:hypothetical protein